MQCDNSTLFIMCYWSEVAVGVQIVYTLKWEVGHRNGVVKVPAGAEVEDKQVDANSFTPDRSKSIQNLKMFKVWG